MTSKQYLTQTNLKKDKYRKPTKEYTAHFFLRNQAGDDGTLIIRKEL